MITLNIQLVNKIIILFAATNKCQFFVSSYQRALQKSQEGKIRYKQLTQVESAFREMKGDILNCTFDKILTSAKNGISKKAVI